MHTFQQPTSNSSPSQSNTTHPLLLLHSKPKKPVIQKKNPYYYSLLKYICGFLFFSICLSLLITNTFFWTFELPLPSNLNKLFFTPPPPPVFKNFTLQELATYDGSHPNLPIYLSILGHVFDVTQGKSFYGHTFSKSGVKIPSSSYSIFSGRDASRAFVTGCFNDPAHFTHDLRGLSPEQLNGIHHWLQFYMNRPKYFQVGHAILPPIHPDLPIPGPCTLKKTDAPPLPLTSSSHN